MERSNWMIKKAGGEDKVRSQQVLMRLASIPKLMGFVRIFCGRLT